MKITKIFAMKIWCHIVYGSQTGVCPSCNTEISGAIVIYGQADMVMYVCMWNLWFRGTTSK